jgi:bifunctional DNase/RNase
MLLEVKVGALIMDPNSSSPIVVLKGVDSEIILPIWVGSYEANAIALEIEKMVSQRPMTHDLLRNMITQLKYKLERIIVNDLADNTFYAVLELIDDSGKSVTLDARPSDAIALALRADCPIFVTQKVLDLSSSTSTVSSKLPSEETVETHKPAEEWPDVIG